MFLQPELVAVHPAAEDEIFQRIIQPLFHSIHLLLAYCGIEDGLLTVQMHKGYSALIGHDAVVVRRQSFGCRKLITCLESLALCQYYVMCAPRFVRHLHIGLLLFYRHLHMHHGFVCVGPYLYPSLTVGNLTVAVAKHQLLAKRLHIERAGQMHAEASQLQQSIILVETAATAEIEKHVAILTPYIHTYVAATARHRL